MKETGNLLLEIDKMVLAAVNNGAKLLLPTENLFPKSIVEAGIGGKSPIILFCFVDNNFYLMSKDFDYPLDRFVAVALARNGLENLLSCSNYVSIETLRIELQSRATNLDSIVEDLSFQYINNFKRLYLEDKNKMRIKILKMIKLSNEENAEFPYNKEIRGKFIRYLSNYFLNECAKEFYEALLWAYQNSETNNFVLDGLICEILNSRENRDLFFSRLGYPINEFVAHSILIDFIKTKDEALEFLKDFVNYHKSKGSTPIFNVEDFSVFSDYLSVYFKEDKAHLDLFKESDFKIILDFSLKGDGNQGDNLVYKDILENNPIFEVDHWSDFIENGIIELKGLSEELNFLSNKKIKQKIFGRPYKETCRNEMMNYYIFLKIYKGLSRTTSDEKLFEDHIKDKKNLNLLRKKVKSIKSILESIEFLEANDFI